MTTTPSIASNACLALAATSTVHAQERSKPKTAVSGEAKSAKTKTLEAGARLLQSKAPLRDFDVYLVGFHPLKDHPDTQIEARHYCHQVNQDFAQCVLFDGNTGRANMNDVEYIISEKLFAGLPEEERKYWHPHNGETLSGQLVALGIPQATEKSLMKTKIYSYGTTWHSWNTGMAGQAGDRLPLGDPMLAWSFSRYGGSCLGWPRSATRRWAPTPARSARIAPICGRWPNRSPAWTT
ncbi:DUF1264 domain-containing protein [Noviherbaspirillum sp. L7-7A]|uniref:DUF1264 domain-containing protein n=1 Tax=Noviherbaspirillum sp. L7-7A TaxID=2850560 RepID=UPI002013906D|nr:DUF1264 domain-containing protein [Noviherbaspirillum sp. L7-7A]